MSPASAKGPLAQKAVSKEPRAVKKPKLYEVSKKAEKAEAMAEMQKNLPSYQREQAAKAEGDNCVVM